MLKREYKVNLKSFVIWTSIIVLMLIVVFAIYPSLMKDVTMMDQMLATMPKELLQMFNMDITSLSTSLGWLTSEGYILITLLGGCYAAILGGTILLKEEDDGTIEFLYTKPISRNKIIIQKILVGLSYVLLFNVIISLTNLIGLRLSNCFDFTKWLGMSLLPIVSSVIFFLVTMFISTFLRKTRRSMGLSLGIVFGSYIISILSNLSDKLEFLSYISPFEYVNIRWLINNGSIEPVYMILSFFLIIILLFGTFYNYNKKEF